MRIDRETLIKDLYNAMIHIGVLKHLWVDRLALSEHEFDEYLENMSKVAERVAKGDDEGLAILAEHNKRMLIEMVENVFSDEEGDDDADSYN